MRIVFFGTPLFAAEILSFLIDSNVPIAGVVTQPDRPKGRDLRLAASPVKEVAQKRLVGIPVLQPEKASQDEFLATLSSLNADLYVVVAFGQILPQKLLDIPPLGCINLHASLLPRWRGAAPMQRALMAGDLETGVCVQKMVRQMDAGDVIAEVKIGMPAERTLGELESQLCGAAKPLLLEVIRSYERGIPEARGQEADQITYAPKITPQETQIDWKGDAIAIHNQVRGLSPRPGAWTWVEWNGEKKKLKILKTRVSTDHTPRLNAKEWVVRCGKGCLEILFVQPEGKGAMPMDVWLRGIQHLDKLFITGS